MAVMVMEVLALQMLAPEAVHQPKNWPVQIISFGLSNQT